MGLVKVILFGKGFFPDGIKLRIFRGDHPALPEWAIKITVYLEMSFLSVVQGTGGGRL